MIDLTWLHLHPCDEKKVQNHLTKLILEALMIIVPVAVVSVFQNKRITFDFQRTDYCGTS